MQKEKRVEWIGDDETKGHKGTITRQQTSPNGIHYTFIQWDGDQASRPYSDQTMQKYIIQAK